MANGVVAAPPGDDWETVEATRALVDTPGTCYLRLDRTSAGDTHVEGERFTLGKGRVVARGSRVAVIACGSILGEVRRAASTLAPAGIVPTVVSLHTLQPIDAELICSLAREHAALLTVEEHVLAGGLGSAVAEVLADAGAFPARFRRLGIENCFVSEVGSQEYLRGGWGLMRREGRGPGRVVHGELRPLALSYREGRGVREGAESA